MAFASPWQQRGCCDGLDEAGITAEMPGVVTSTFSLHVREISQGQIAEDAAGTPFTAWRMSISSGGQRRSAV